VVNGLLMPYEKVSKRSLVTYDSIYKHLTCEVIHLSNI